MSDGLPDTRRAAGRRLARAAALLLAAGLAGCAHSSPPPAGPQGGGWNAPPAVDNVTLALWHLDETAGNEAIDSGPYRLAGAMGLDTRPTFGRFRGARQFQRTMDSFVYLPANPMLDLGGDWSIEAWVKPDDFSPVECSAIAARWSQSTIDQSWLLGLTGYGRIVLADAPAPPLLFSRALGKVPPGLVGFIFQAEAASEPRAFISTLPLDRGRWTHVAVTRSGAELRIFLDGRLDAQYAIDGRVRTGLAPLVIGNVLDPRWMTTSRGPLGVTETMNLYPFYAFDGAIDEVRISSVSRGGGVKGGR